MKVGLDCANGSSWNMAQQIFDSLGAKTFVINAEPDGTNINRDAGSTHIEGLQKYVVENGWSKSMLEQILMDGKYFIG